jgi:hypothetical protein
MQPDHLGLRIGEAMAFEWVSDPSHVPDMPHHVGHFWHPDCGWAVLIEVANDRHTDC